VNAQTISGHRRVVVKVGSALLVDSSTGRVDGGWLAALADDLAGLAEGGADILVVSSGAIALGRNALGLPRGPLKLEEAQAAAAVGQVTLASTWSSCLGDRGLRAAQILLTLGDTEERRRYLNARATLATLLKLRAVPVINENDTVATSEIRYGDNDRLAARVAAMVGADCLVLLSDIDGLYTEPPANAPHAQHVPFVPVITPEIEAMAGAAGSELSRGGMKTKIEAGKIANAAGAAMVIASGRVRNPLAAIDNGARCTWFAPQSSPASARKAWIAGHLEPRGMVTVDAGALLALRRGKSLLPAGVTAVAGSFTRGDTVVIVTREGSEVGRGLVAFDHDDARKIVGRHSRDIEAVLGYRGRTVLIHCDDMVVRDTGPAGAVPAREPAVP
jgi:glutamate 5-kinase